MQTTESLRRKIHSAEDLLSVVRTMKTLAAVSIRHYELALDSLADYHRTVDLGLHALLYQRTDLRLDLLREVDGGRALVVFGTDQGLCGQFNERVVEFAQSTITGGRDPVFVAAVGERCAGLLEEAALTPTTTFNVPSALAGVGSLVQDLLLLIDDWRGRDPAVQVDLVANQPLGSALYQPHGLRLLPVARTWLAELIDTAWDSRTLPSYRMDWHELFAALLQQHLYVILFRTLVGSLASEDASRLAAMQNAERNIQERLDELEAAYHHRRQETITAELLDIVAGFEAVIND